MPLLRRRLNRNLKRPRRRGRILAVSGGGVLFLSAPLLWVHLSLYRANLAMASETFPSAPNLSQGDRILVVSPHPDDETLGAGGLIATARRLGLPVRLVFLTNGDGSQSTRLYENVRQPRAYPNQPETFVKIAAMRQKEALAAAAKMGIEAKDVSFLGYPDGGLATMWRANLLPGDTYRSAYTHFTSSRYDNARTPDAPYNGVSALTDVREVMAEFKPTLILTTHPADTHPDHRTAYDLCAAALEELRSGDEPAGWTRQTRLMGFLVHHGPWPAPAGFKPDLPMVPPAALKDTDTNWMTMALTDQDRESKRAALECYVSQLATTPRYLRSFVRRNELYGVVPAVQLKATGQTVSIKRDAVRDGLLPDLAPSADIRGLSLTPESNGNVALHVQLLSPPSPRFRYEVTLHQLPLQAAATPKLWRIRLRSAGKGWTGHATDAGGAERDIAVIPAPFGLQMDLPIKVSKGQVLMLSAGSRFHSSLVDQTDTAVARLE
jgi:LmbE family N-acetylglucosaminyl deacetylase